MQDIEFDDGSHVLLRKLEREYDPTSRMAAAQIVEETRERGELITGLLFVDTAAQDLCGREHMTKTPLAQLREEDLRISREEWAKLTAPSA